MRLYFKPFLIHLAVSVFIAIVCYWLVFMCWYPQPFQATERVMPIFLMVLVVDVIVGPLFTLFVYKPGKKDLAFDMAVIILVQAAALGYGIWSLDKARPAWLVFSVDRFELVRKVDIDARRIEEAAPEFQAPALLGPQWAVAEKPENHEDQQQILFESVAGGFDLANRPELYKPLEESQQVVEGAIRPLGLLDNINDPEKVRVVLERYPDATGWVPMMTTHESLVVLMRGGELNAVVRLNGFE